MPTLHRVPPCPRRPAPALATLSLHDALPICAGLEGPAHRDHLGLEAALGDRGDGQPPLGGEADDPVGVGLAAERDRKSTRLNSSHVAIAYRVLSLKKKRTRGHGSGSPSRRTA